MFRKKNKVEVVPEWMIVGLGNPGPEYRGTRHNVGFEVIDALAERFKIKLDRSKHRARFGSGKISESGVMLVKPLTFMNLSGQAVAPLAREHAIKPDKVVVIADDLDLPTGKLRLRETGSAGGHNGHKSLIHSLGTQDYPRFKIGVGKGGADTISHVLGGFTPGERIDIKRAIEGCVEAVTVLLTEGPLAAQTVVDRVNKAS
jgi:PTH1 family peptidyl-tRNA hydrolase